MLTKYVILSTTLRSHNSHHFHFIPDAIDAKEVGCFVQCHSLGSHRDGVQIRCLFNSRPRLFPGTIIQAELWVTESKKNLLDARLNYFNFLCRNKSNIFSSMGAQNYCQPQTKIMKLILLYPLCILISNLCQFGIARDFLLSFGRKSILIWVNLYS
jgi:hypothetical protein